MRSRWVGRGIRAAVVIAILVGLYALAGFLVVPRVVRSELSSYVRDHYHRTLSLAAVRFNPFTLNLDTGPISLPDADSSPMVGANGLHVELAIATLWRLAPSFKSIVLDQPFAHVIVRRDGKLNLADLAAPTTASSAPARSSPPTTLYIDRLAVTGGRLIYEDRSHPTPFRTELEPIDFALDDFRTAGAPSGRYTLDFDMAPGAHFHGSGSLAAEPFASQGAFTLTRLPIRLLWSYLRDELHFEVASGALALQGDYTFVPTGASPQERVDLTRLTVSRLGVRPLKQPSDVVDLGAVDVLGAHLDLEHHSLAVDSVHLDGGTVEAALDADGNLNLAGLLGGAFSTAAKPAPSAPAAPWTISVPDISVSALKLVAEDREVSPAAAMTLDHVALRVRGFRRPGEAPLAISVAAAVGGDGKLAVDGSYVLASGAAQAHIVLDHVDLTPLEPFLAERSAFALRSGWLSAKLDANRTAHGVLIAKGNTEIGTLRVVDDLLGRDFIKWRRLAVEGLAYRSRPDSIAIRRIVAVAPYARVIVTPDRKLNIIEDFAAAHRNEPALRPDAAGSGASGAQAARARSMSIAIHRVDVMNGSAHYTDLWIQPHFFLAIQQLNGDVTGLSSDPRSRATVKLDGKVDRYAPISVSGTLNLLSQTRFSNMKLDFHGVQLTMATPYSARFAGYKIKKGTMSADITYHLENGELSADPHFVIDQLELGEKVASPDAIHLPLKFAIALLKDRHGVIDLNLPISGSLKDPEFRIGPLIVKIVVNLLTKAVTSPFALLGKLIGGGPQLKYVDFKPGSAVLDGEARKRLAALAKALEERPALKLDVPSDYSPALDPPALASAVLEKRLAALAAQPAASRKRRAGPQAAANPADPATRFGLLVALYRSELGAKTALPPEAAAVLARDGKKTSAPLEPAIAALESTLRSRIHVDDHDLARLARERAVAIEGALLDGTRIDPARVFVLSTGQAKTDGSEVRIELALE